MERKRKKRVDCRRETKAGVECSVCGSKAKEQRPETGSWHLPQCTLSSLLCRVPRGWEPPLSLFSLDDDDDNERNRAGTRLREAAEKFLAGGGVSSIQMLSLSFNEITNEINRHLSQTSHKDTK